MQAQLAAAPSRTVGDERDQRDLPRLLKGVSAAEAMTLDEHERLHGPLPATRNHRRHGEIIELIEQAGLRGRGGAGFPTARKMRAVEAARRRPVVVVNATEGEPASFKDRVLITRAPHLVLDGAMLAAHALGAEQVLVAVCESARESFQAGSRAIAERRGEERRRPSRSMRLVPPGYVVGHESALVNALNGEVAAPSFAPPAPFERGVANLPTLVSNAETYAHIALICRHGPRWFREVGTAAEPGSALVTLSGCVAGPGVYEVELGLQLRALVAAAGGLTGEPRAALLGGYGGTWIAGEYLAALELCDARLHGFGASLGAGVLVLLDSDACPVAETLRVVDWLATQSAGQCGPCARGLPAIAAELARIATGRCAVPAAHELKRLAMMVQRRGACGHPDGACTLVLSAIDAFGPELADHARHGACDACAGPARLPLPGGGWR